MPSDDRHDAGTVDAAESRDPGRDTTDDTDGADADLSAADVERITRRVVREELDRERRERSAPTDDGSGPWTVLAGVFVGLTVLLPLSALVLSSLSDVGLPVEAVGAIGVLAFLALVAYGWRFPPFR